MNFSYPQRLSVEVTTRCNYSCAICPKHSPNYNHPAMDMDPETFKKLEPLFPNLRSLVLSGIGEPLLNPNLEEMIFYARRRMKSGSSIGFQTNGSLLTAERLAELLRAGLRRLCISVDCIFPVPGFHEPEISFHALDIASEIKNRNKYKLELGIEIVITKDNLTQILSTIKEAYKYGIDFVILSHLIPFSPDSVQKVCYETNNRESVKIFKKWYDKLIKNGYTAEDWIDGIKKKALPEFFPQGNEALRFYSLMYEEAERKGYTLNLKNLLIRNEELLSKTESVLKEVANLRKELNLRIKIPRLNPKPKRNCEFIEREAMYISADGEVSPCYFYWHSYTVYISGLKKGIRRWSFGNIREKDPIQIYNSHEYQKFRESVLRYDFPYCYDCNFALCDLMELEEFIGDCYTNQIPCGACLWCGGLFYCMI